MLTFMQVQDIVVGNKNFTEVTKPSEIVQLLLNDEQLASLDNTSSDLSGKTAGPQPSGSDESHGRPVRDLWNEEGDDFFGHPSSTGLTTVVGETANDEYGTPISSGARGKKRKTGATRGRKPGPKAKRNNSNG
jgi:DNA helicase INO80